MGKSLWAYYMMLHLMKSWVLCHGVRATKEDTSTVNLAVALQNEGISVFSIDFAGNGESEGSFVYGNYWREADDLHTVVQYFCGVNRVVAASLGHSKGGGIVLLYASKYHDICTVINASGRYDRREASKSAWGKTVWEESSKMVSLILRTKQEMFNIVSEESLMDHLNTNMREACLQIDKECRVLTVHESADKIIPVQDAHEFDKIIPNHKLHIVQGANHGYTKHQAQLASVVLNFVKASLKQDQNTFNAPGA